VARARTVWRPLDGVLVLDKPVGMSSNAALQQARRLFRAEKAGHTGALDPLASGVLPIMFGEATKLSSLLLDGDKSYVADVAVGARTTTGDTEGEVVERSDASRLTAAGVEAALCEFRGEIEQVPPMYSALKRDGRPLYELAREGQVVDRAARRVVISSLRLLQFEPGTFRIEVACSKGTYIRTLAEDIARAAGQCAHLSGLRRTSAGPFALTDARTFAELDQLAADAGEAGIDAWLLPLARAASGLETMRVDPGQASALAAGRCITIEKRSESRDPLAILDQSGRLLGLAELRPGGCVQPRRWMRSPANEERS